MFHYVCRTNSIHCTIYECLIFITLKSKRVCLKLLFYYRKDLQANKGREVETTHLSTNTVFGNYIFEGEAIKLCKREGQKHTKLIMDKQNGEGISLDAVTLSLILYHTLRAS